MKILHVFDMFSMSSGGGTVNLLYRLAKAQAKRGHEVSIYTSDHTLDKDYVNSLKGVTVYPFHCWSRLAGFFFTPHIIGEAKRNLRNYDIVHLHLSRSFQNIVIHHYAKKYRIPYIVDAHGSTPRSINEKNLKWLIKLFFDIAIGNRILKDASLLIAETKVGVSEYLELGANRDRITVMPALLDTSGFAELPQAGLFRSKYRIKEKYVIMFLGRIHYVKGLDFLVESFAELAKPVKDVILVIVGPDDGHKTRLDRLIKSLDLSDKVLFTGFLDGVEKLSALVDADILVQTSIIEQGAWVPLEGVLCGTPIIVTKHTGAGEDVKSIDAGYLVEYGNKKELANTINYIFNNPAEARIKTQRAKEIIESQLSIERGIEKLEVLYETCIRAKKTNNNN